MTDSHDEWRQLSPAPSIPKRAAIYIRSSSRANASSSVDEQKRAARAYCEAQGCQIVAEYVEM